MSNGIHIRKELQALSERMFTADLLDRLLDAQHQEFMAGGDDGTVADYRLAKEVLPAVLDEQKLAQVSALEDVYRQEAKLLMERSFGWGINAAYDHYHLPEPKAYAFEETVEKQEKSGRDLSWNELRSRQQELLDTIGVAQDECIDNHLASIQCAWDQWIYGVQRYAFYLGYRYAFSILDDMLPDGVPKRLWDRLLILEHEMGFTLSWAEREQAASRAARKK